MRPVLLDRAAQARFERDGYATIACLDAEAVATTRALHRRLGEMPGDGRTTCISSFQSTDQAYKVAVHEGLTEILRPHLPQIFDRQRALIANFLVKWPGPDGEMELHQDTNLVDERDHCSAELWIALEDTTEENGQLWMVPGSHRWIPTLRGIRCWYESPFDDVRERIVDRHAVPVPLKAGEAIVFNHAVLHFSLPNRTDRPRLVAILDVIPEEASHVHYFGNEDGSIEGYAIDESFWLENNPSTLGSPPDATRSLGVVDFTFEALDGERLDELVAAGRAVDRAAKKRRWQRRPPPR